MQFYLRKHGKLHPRDQIAWLDAMNKYIAFIPQVADQVPTRRGDWLEPCVAFTPKEMVEIVIFMFPAKWTEQMMAANMKPYNMEISDQKGYLPGLQKTQSSESAVPRKNDKYDKTKRKLPGKWNKNQRQKREKNKGNPSNGGGKHFCIHCKNLQNGNHETHKRWVFVFL